MLSNQIIYSPIIVVDIYTSPSLLDVELLVIIFIRFGSVVLFCVISPSFLNWIELKERIQLRVFFCSVEPFGLINKLLRSISPLLFFSSFKKKYVYYFGLFVDFFFYVNNFILCYYYDDDDDDYYSLFFFSSGINQ